MTNAEKEARALIVNILDEIAASEGYRDYREHEDDARIMWKPDIGKMSARILRFAREYGPEIARQHIGQDATISVDGDADAFGRFLRGEALTPPLSPVEDTTPPGWTREILGTLVATRPRDSGTP